MDETLRGSVTSSRITIGDRLVACRGVGPGFDHLRVGLSLLILFWHSFGISYGIGWTRSDPVVAQLRPLICTLLPMFFALSGFLVMGSAVRINDLRTFITFRVLRILPALATEISLSALILGPLLTAYALPDYFGDRRFLEYFGSLVGRVQYILPGLFLANPSPEVVNGALWTVGPEITCYIVMALLILTAAYRNPRWCAAFAALYLLACIASDCVLPPTFNEVLPTKALVLAFLAGGLIYHYRSAIPFSHGLLALAFVGAICSIALAQQGGLLLPFMYVGSCLLAYVTTTIGLTGLPPLPFFHRGDYSYGIYIFGFPVQQSIAHFFPDHRIWWFNFLLAFPLTLLFAIASWHLIEKPVLGLRKRILNARTPQQPRPPGDWSKREFMIAAALLTYGAFVAYSSDVFPLQRVVNHFFYAPAPAPPPII